MNELISLLIQLLPKQVKIINYLKLVPDAVGEVKDLMAELQRIQTILKRPSIPKTPHEEAILDASIAAMKDDPYLAPEKKQGPPSSIRKSPVRGSGGVLRTKIQIRKSQ